MELNSNNDSMSLKELCNSFKEWPRIFMLLWEVDCKTLLLIIVLTITSGVIPIATLIASQNLINSVVSGNSVNYLNVLKCFAILIIISIASEIISSLRNYYERMFQTVLNYKLNLKIMKKASSLSLADFENPEVYDKLQRAENEGTYRPYQIFSSLMGLINGLVTLVSSSMILILWKWWLLIALIVIPFTSVMYFLKIGRQEYLTQWKRTPKQRKSWYYNFVSTHDTYFKEVKLYNLNDYFLKSYKNLNQVFLSEDKVLIKRRTIATFLFQMLNQFTGDAIVLSVIWSAIKKEIPIGNLVGYIKAVSLVQSNSQAVISTLFTMYQNNLYMKLLFEFFDLSEKEKIRFVGTSNCTVKDINCIELKNVFFKYPNSNEGTLKRTNNPGLLDGITGTVLVLLSAISSVLTTWDLAFLLE